MLDFLIESVTEPSRLARLVERLGNLSVIALDIETVDWWNRHQERVALIQLAYRLNGEIKVAVIDALALVSLEPLRQPLEQQTTLKVIHNAAFDATRLWRHFKFEVTPIHDTMVAARLNREKKYSLQAQASTHLNLQLDKGARRSDWSRRPLTPQQLYYAATDAAATLSLFEHQAERHLFGNYRLKGKALADQASLPLDFDSINNTATAPEAASEEQKRKLQDKCGGAHLKDHAALLVTESPPPFLPEISGAALAILGIIAELPDRYGPQQLMASVGAEQQQQRVGLAGWIVDRTLGINAEFDVETIKLALGELSALKLIAITLTGRLSPTVLGASLWQKLKTI